MIDGNTEIIAHIGFPTHAFKAPMIYNPWFEKAGVNAVVVPMGCQTPDYPVFLRSLFKLTNIRGALITMPHKPKVAGCRSARTCCSSRSLLTLNFLGFRSPRPTSSAPSLRWLREAEKANIPFLAALIETTNDLLSANRQIVSRVVGANGSYGDNY